MGHQLLLFGICKKWFAGFKNGDFEVEDCERLCRPVETGTARIMTVVDQSLNLKLREVDDVVGVSHITI